MSRFGTYFDQSLREASNAATITSIEEVQQLWSGYGTLLRLRFDDHPPLIVKHIKPNSSSDSHPRGWNSNLSHLRKLKSYQVELNWYQNYNHQLKGKTCRIPKSIYTGEHQGEYFLILEDLEIAGFDQVKQSVKWSEIELCIDWLANFHGLFINQSPNGIWDIGTYWHLDTRPDELARLEPSEPLKSAAKAIDQKLNQSRFKTFVHGDAKLANFLFSKSAVAAVDFQYVGGGCGMKDLAYFIGSCLRESECESRQDKILTSYFRSLKRSIKIHQPDINFHEVEAEWRELYYFAWADFHRFLKGWSPGHWKINTYSEKVTKTVLNQL